ncbi:MAG: hypothetical protein ACXAC5_05455 [Promethearchaeota archaeon]|jgi:hypothetical protein
MLEEYKNINAFLEEIKDLKTARGLLERLYESIWYEKKIMNKLDKRLQIDLDYYFRKFNDEE